MDIFKRNRNLIITIVVLVIINITTLLLLWFGRPNATDLRGSGNEKVRIQEMLKAELGFSDKQAKQFIDLRQNHKEKSIKLDDEIMVLKKEMFAEAMYGNKSNISDSLLNLSLQKQSQLEKLTFEHFQKLKQICTADQQKKLFEIVHRLIGPPQHGGPPPNAPGPKGENRGGPPPPGEHPPIRN